MGEAFDYTTPFRAALAEIADILDLQGPSSLVLPEQGESEDFVEGSYQYDGTAIGVYYEHSLGYLSLSASSENILREIASRLISNIEVVES
jgi:hypothetical protein